MGLHSSLALQLDSLFPEGLSGLIFDCDGVLVDSRDANIGYYDRLLAELGHPPMSESQAAYAQMATAQQALEILFSPEDLKRLPDITQKIPYKTVTLPLLHLEPGVTDLLYRLRERGIQLGVHTNRGQGMWDLLDFFDLREVFNPVITADVVLPKPAPDGVLRILHAWKAAPRTVGFIGDSSTDAQAAKGASVPILAYRNPELSADLHVSSFSSLREALEELPVRRAGAVRC